MFERFTDRARQSLVLAMAEAFDLGHGYLGTEHILIGLAREGSGVAARVLDGLGISADALRRETLMVLPTWSSGSALLGNDDAEALEAIGIDLNEVRRAAEEAFGPGALDRPVARPPKRKQVPFTEKAKRVLELALHEALALKHNYIGTEHVLLGLVAQDDGVAMAVLERLGADPDVVRRRVMDILRQVG